LLAQGLASGTGFRSAPPIDGEGREDSSNKNGWPNTGSVNAGNGNRPDA